MKFFNISYLPEACTAAKRLEEISLGKSLLSSVDYIERLIDSERRSKRPNKENRLIQAYKQGKSHIFLKDFIF